MSNHDLLGRSPKGVQLQHPWRGTVVRVTAAGPWVEVPRLARGFEYGPCDVYLDSLRGDADAGGHDDGAGGAVPDHQHAPQAIAAGDRVLVVFIEGLADQPAIIGRRP